MTEKELKRLLWEYPNLKQKQAEIAKEKQALQDWANVVREISSPVMDGMPYEANISDPTYAKTQKYLDEYAKEINLLHETCLNLSEDAKIVRALLKRLTEREYRIIELYYFEGRQWFYISRTVHWCERQCRRIRDTAVHKMLE